jgi:hypothetical protein
MSNVILDKLRTERDQVRAAAVAIAEGENFDPEDANFKELETRASGLDSRIKSLSDLLTQQAAADALDGRMAKATKQIEQQRQQPQQQTQTRESWGTLFTRSDIYTDYAQSARGRSPRYEIDVLETRALPLKLSDLVAAGLDFGKTTVDVTAPPLPTPLLDAVSTITVSTNAVEYVSWKVVSGAAAVVAEGAAKPPIEYGPTVVPDTLKNIAGYTQLTRQAIEDAPAVRSYIDTDLRRQVLLKEESEAAAALAAATLQSVTGDNMLAAIRVAMATVQSAGFNPNAVLLNPADFADLDIAVMGVTVNGPTVRQSFWGLTPLPSPAQPAGTAVVGDFQTGINHFVRSQVALYISDSHADTFLSNVFTLLAERRALTAVVRPDALCEAAGPTPAP